MAASTFSADTKAFGSGVHAVLFRNMLLLLLARGSKEMAERPFTLLRYEQEGQCVLSGGRVGQ